MGVTGEIVRSVFARNKSVHRHDDTHRHQARIINAVEKKRWQASVRSYLCGDHERNADDDSSSLSGLESNQSNCATNISIITTHQGGDVVTSVNMASARSSEATVNQPICDDPKEGDNESNRKHNSALIIQFAFRNFRAKCVQEGANILDMEHLSKASPRRESTSTSVEVQTGNSSDIFSIREEITDMRPADAMQRRTKARVSKIQEDWDDSTVSSVMLKARIQNRLEAATRRERALAYAFSQQLRICSKRKQTTGDETNTGWSWLERWMAARQPEMKLEEDNATGMRKKMMDAASMEEKESCGSNEVSSMFETSVPRPSKIRSNRTRSFSGQSSRSSHLCPRDPESMKKVCDADDRKEMRKIAKQYSSMNKRDRHQE